MKDPNPITFDWETFKWSGITKATVMRWEATFPDVDVVNEILMNMPLWLEKNQTVKSSHKKQWRKFIMNWLRRAQIKAVLG